MVPGERHRYGQQPLLKFVRAVGTGAYHRRPGPVNAGGTAASWEETMTLDELRTMIASSAPRDWSRIKDGFVSDPVPQNFPPGPEAPAALVVRARAGRVGCRLRACAG